MEKLILTLSLLILRTTSKLSISNPKGISTLEFEGIPSATLTTTENKIFKISTESPLLEISSKGIPKFKVETTINYFNIEGSLKIRHNKGEISDQWRLVYFEPFESGESKNWQGEGILRPCGIPYDFALHHICESETSSLRKKINNLGKHNEVKIKLNFHFIDRWEGEQAYLKLDGEVLWSRSHKWCHNIFAKKCLEKGVDVCGSSYPDLVGQVVEYTMKHTKEDVVIEIGSDLEVGNCKANWAIDNLMIYVK